MRVKFCGRVGFLLPCGAFGVSGIIECLEGLRARARMFGRGPGSSPPYGLWLLNPFVTYFFEANPFVIMSSIVSF